MTRDLHVSGLLCDATEWRLLALLLSRPRAGWRDEVRTLARETSDALLRRGSAEAEAASEGAYHALLGPGGPASPREAAYLGFGDPGRLLADLAARYAAFGFAPRGEEPDDHVAVECDFVSYLFLKEVYALCAGSSGNADVAHDARARFLSEHTAVAGRGLAANLPAGAPPYLRAAAEALVARLPEVTLPQRATPEDEALACGCPDVTGRRE
jgi:nitrate reductase assembly molybdenum cofactor insertion protein NarJ